MFTSRAEYRLLLREDNADLRLTELGHRIGAVGTPKFERIQRKSEQVRYEIERLESTVVIPSPDLNARLRLLGSAEVTQPASLAQLLRRPELPYQAVAGLTGAPPSTELAADVVMQVEVSLKYSGYVKRQNDAVDRFKRMEEARIPDDIDYAAVRGLSREACERLAHIRPRSLGQAARVPGVTPAALSLLSVHLKRYGGC
jgi:tRNA uridine 5-carboxymethylaminomethyl modification enzyme